MKKLTTEGFYFQQDHKPFFWLADTAWLIFTNLSEEDAEVYFRNRAEKGYNVIQAVMVYATEGMKDCNMMPVSRLDVESEAYWEHCDRVIRLAAKYGLYMALLPTWGWIVKRGLLNEENAERYGRFLVDRYGAYDNIIWLLGGDIKAAGFEKVYEILGRTLKAGMPDTLIGFHPFGRCTSTLWFPQADWLDFHMFQSGHRRYDQCTMGAWDDTANETAMFGEDNWRFVLHDHAISNKPVVDGEPSYEQMPQGLHDPSQPYWQARDVRRYAYWSVLSGAAGHTYGDNCIISFYDGCQKGVTYGARDHWQDALHHEGSGQMQYLKDLMMDVRFDQGRMADELLMEGQKKQYDRIAVWAGDDYLVAYNYTGRSFLLNTSTYLGAAVYYMNPATGDRSYAGTVTEKEYHYQKRESYTGDPDVVVFLRMMK